MRLFECSHKWVAQKRSNALQLDDMGYPLRLFICRCSRCGRYDQQWRDVPRKEVEELDSGESVLVKWDKSILVK